jgi:hypothetical protein
VRRVTRGGDWPSARRAETRLWTGPVGHFVGGAIDLAQALLRYARSRARRARSARAQRPAGR